MFKRLILLAAALVFLCSSAGAQLMNSPWPKIHNTVENTGYTTNIGTAIGRLKWIKNTEKPITSSPALDNNGRIYFGSLDTYFYCLNRETGDLIWRYKTGDAIEHCSPAIDVNGFVYIGSNDKKLYAFDTNTIDANNPQPTWVVTATSGIYGSPTIASNGNILFGTSDGFFYCIDPLAQSPYPAPNNALTSHIWYQQLPGIWSTPTIDNTYYLTYSPYGQPTVIIGSLSNELRTELKYTLATSPFVNCYFIDANPIKVTLHFTWFIFDVESGAEIFTGPREVAGRTGVFGSIVQTGPNELLIPTEDGIFNDSWGYAGDTITRNYPTDNSCDPIVSPIVNSSRPTASGRILATPALLPEGSYYLGHGNTMTRFFPTGSEYFSIVAAGSIESSAAVDETFSVYFGCNGGVFYCINTNTPGNPLRWRYPEIGNLTKKDGSPAEIISSPAIDNDAKHSIYFGASDGNMYAFYDGASIQGKVTTDGTTPVASVEITLKDSANMVVASTSTNTAGTFEFFGIKSGQYTLIPKKNGLIFNPAEAPVTLGNLGAYVEFTAAIAFTITGRVVRAAGATGLPNVSVGLITRNSSGEIVYTDNSIVTDVNGYYTFTNIGFGTSEITPSLSGWGFDPPAITQAIPVGTAGGQTYTLANFEGTLGYQVSGVVINPTTNLGIGNVTVRIEGATSFTPVEMTTAPDGTYSFTGLTNGTYQVTPSYGIYIFSPPNRTVVINNASVLNQNFYGTPGGVSTGGLLNSPWPKIHKDVRNSGYTSEVGTAIGKIKWKFLTEKPITSSPILDNNNRIYFGSADKNLYCLDRTTGGLIWKYETGDYIDHSSPAIDVNGILYIGSADSKLYAFDTINIDLANPQPLWTFPTYAGVYGSPTIADDGTIIFGSADGFLYALNPTDPPSVKWQINLGTLWATPTIDYVYPTIPPHPWYASAPVVLIGSTLHSAQLALNAPPKSVSCSKIYTDDLTQTVASSFYVLDLEFGTELAYGLRSTTVDGIGIYGSIGIQTNGNYIFPFEGAGVGVGWIGADSVAELYPYDNNTCTLVPSTASSIAFAPGSGRVEATPTVTPTGYFYIGQGDVLSRINPSNSADFIYTAEGEIRSSVAVDGNANAYFGCNGGVFYCINSNSPAQPLRWRYPETGNLVKTNGDAAEIISSPAIDNDVKHSIYFGASDGAMYAFYDGASISGKVTTDGTTPLAAVEITLKDSAKKVVATTSTDTAGNFEFSGIGSGQYTVKAQKDNFIFNPTEAPVTLSNVDAYVEFTAASAFTFTGRVVSAADGTGLPNVSLALVTRNASQVIVYTDNSTVTDANGNYTFINIGYGTSVITPSLAGWGFEPPSITQAIPPGTAGGRTYTLANFEGTLGYQVSGKVINPEDNTTNNGIENVQLTLTGDSAFTPVEKFTNPQGMYSFTGLLNGTYTVTPSLGLYKFSPKTLSVEIKNASVLNQNFYGATGLTISGTIKLSGSDTSFDGFTVNLYRDDETLWSKIFNRNKPRTLVATVAVASNGYFIFMGITAGKYIVEPSAVGYGFDPASTKVSASLTDVANLIFNASAGFSISGKIANIIGFPQSGIIVNLTNDATGVLSTTTTNLDGGYTFTGLEAGIYTVMPEPSDFYTVTPATKSVTIALENQRKINFLVFSFCTKTYITLPFWGTNGSVVNIIGTNFGPPPTDNVTAVAITLSDGTEASYPAGVYFGTKDPTTWVKASVQSWTPFYITAEMPLMDIRLMRVWVVRAGLTTCIKIVPTNFFINTRM
jgi:outer membrane protein assembly factor BamB